MLSIVNPFRENKNLVFIFILFSNLIAALSFDVFFVAQKDIGLSLGASYLQVGQIQGMWSLGLCVGQFIFAPMTDDYGRKNIFIFGMSITCMSAFICFYLSFFTGIVNSTFGFLFGNFSEIEIMLIMRLIQGIGISVQILCSRVMINDIFSDKKKISKAFSLLTTFILVFAVIAPLISGQMVEAWGWSSLFLLMSFTALLLVFVLFLVPETLDKSKEIKNDFMYLSYLSVFNNKQYIGYILINSLMFVWIFATIFSMPIIVMNIFEYDPISFSIFGSLMMIIAILGSLTNQKLLDNYSINKLIFVGSMVMLIFSFITLIVGLFFIHGKNISLFGFVLNEIVSLSFICLLIFIPKMFTPFITSNCITGSLGCHPDKIGIASAVLGISQFGISSFAFTFVGILIDYGFNTISSLAIVQFLSILLCILIYLTLINRDEA